MDAFTENILARARERQRLLQGYSGQENPTRLRDINKNTSSEPNLSEVISLPRKEVASDPNLPSKLSPVDSPSKDMPSSPASQAKTLNIQRDNFNMEIKVTSAENIRVQVEIEEQDDSIADSNISDAGSHCSESGLREESKNRLKRLGKLYAGGDDADISSPIHRTEAKFYEGLENTQSVSTSDKIANTKPKKGLSRLADLADKINHWEDDLSHPVPQAEKQASSSRKTVKAPAPQPPIKSPLKNQKSKAPSPPILNLSPKKDSGIPTASGSPTKGARSPTKSAVSPTKGDAQCIGVTPKKLNWDKSVLDNLESQGFSRTTSSSRLVYSYNDSQGGSTTAPGAQAEQNPQSVTKSDAIAKRAAMFESKPTSPAKPPRDPAMLSVSERKALFEKNKGGALVPKAAFGMSAPVKVDTTMKACESKFIGAQKGINKENEPKVSEKRVIFEKSDPVVTRGTSKPKQPAPKPPPQPVNHATTAVVHQAGGIASKMAALLENKSTISEEQIANKIREERRKEMDLLLNRFNKNKGTIESDEIREVSDESEPDDDADVVDERTAMIKEKQPTVVKNVPKSAEKRKSGDTNGAKADSPHVISVLEDVKRIKVSPPKAGRLYPNLSDIEGTTTEAETRSPSPDDDDDENNTSDGDNRYDSDDPNTSFGRDILQAVIKNHASPKRLPYPDSTGSENSSLACELDEILEEMEDDMSSAGPTPPKQGRHVSPPSQHRAQPSNSFHYKSFNSSVSSAGPKNSSFQSPMKTVVNTPRQSTELPLVVDGDNVMSLTHTVSFYRKQQNEVHTPARRQIVRQPPIEETLTECGGGDSDEIQRKIKDLQDEVNKQQNIISQTSQALNLCSSTPEFSGSTEQVEAERVLLVATHRRQAALHELQRLRVEGTLRPRKEHSQDLPLEKGTLTISNIVLPLQQKYVTALAAAGGKGHHVVCLIKCGEQVASTKLVSTVATSSKNPDVDLYIPGSVTLKNIYSDFTVTFEVYCLQAHEECLPHEVKYHIHKKGSKGVTTPKKGKQESRLLRPPKESPGGPQAVRTSSFAMMGYVVFSVRAVNKKVWSLNNTPSLSPLEGSVEMKISCELAVSIEHRGFLTMFEDVSGFGAWHRRWCLLKGHSLSYWKYPDDERTMAPIDTIDLSGCVTKHVGPVSRDICARLHTFLLERERRAYPQDKDSLVTVCKGDKTVIRHLLSADTKEERIEWCYKLNAALTAIRTWGSSQ
ncbi:anillin isoform X2 [Cylas formicarius]|uniref:anillin isoform X2 n=1 Tax=Cylas formicarius TaxID=197179 RepID=UPI002958640A|nr:anillin isoform X2 [Cylas formicarius]